MADQLHPLSPNPSARYPLSAFDNTFQRSTFITGWLVKGTIDTRALASALRRMTDKWRVLAGRLESLPQPDAKLWQLVVPLGPLPIDYPTFSLTFSTSDVPLSTYITIPLETNSHSLPRTLFLHPDTPRQNAVWVAKSHPLTAWHVTHFPPETSGGASYSCIGFARSHGIFDGIGAASVMRALVAEMRGQEWHVPPPPPEGTHPNPIATIVNKHLVKGSDYPQSGHAALGVKGALWLFGWHLREHLWRGSNHQIFIVPQKCLSSLVSRVRSAVQRSRRDAQVSTGDILVAWIIKAVYVAGTPPETIIHCSNFASFRDLILETDGESLETYLHNSFVPLPYPLLRVREINDMSLPELTLLFSDARRQLSLNHVIAAHQLIASNPISMPVHPDADETLVVSNVSASRILETDWSAVGSEGTLCGYRFSATTTNLVAGNTVFISGRLPDSSTVLDVLLNKERMQNFASAVGILTRTT
ncbi:hypothetical protein FB45DRAFT_902959 [Roridomyces roridus]|uniref:Uncharacterized protein n=1 Tax=Roridomyces roridus TaxID=1738132 RepID=A0AAD7C4A4_9AGAR|nr:hypothetical protein FB45DRAFT_902959 [Roridomyces roridus]